MTTGSVLSVMVTLAIVLGVMGIALRVLRKYTMGGTKQQGTLPMEVLQRLTLGQRQGIAVVRVGTRVLVVSMGDGGVHPVAELDASELAAVQEAAEHTSVIPQSITEGVSKLTTSLSTLRVLTPRRSAAASPEPQRISYVAPMEDFQAVLNIAMSGAVRS